MFSQWEDLKSLGALSQSASMLPEYTEFTEPYNQSHGDLIQAQQENISMYSPQLNSPETQYCCPTPGSEIGCETDHTTLESKLGCETDRITPRSDIGCWRGLPTRGTEIEWSRDLTIPVSEIGCGTGLRIPTPARVATPPGLVIDVKVQLPQSPGQWETFDYDLAVATLQAEAEGTKTPLIKDELRYCIQRKRKASGLDELQVEYKVDGRQQVNHISYFILFKCLA